MRQLLCVAFLLSTIHTASAGEPRPLLTGSYEVARFVPPGGGKEIELGPRFANGIHAEWGRVVLTFDGARLTMTSQALRKKNGRYEACSSSVTGGIVWTRDGYSIPVKVDAQVTMTTFETLTRKHAKANDNTCSVSLDANSLIVVPGAEPKLESPQGTMILKRTSVDVDWKKVVK